MMFRRVPERNDHDARTPLSRSVVGFWLVLLALVLNDHLFKPLDGFPRSVSGKLSDFAGLIVAPVLLAVALGKQSRWLRVACFALVLGVFTAIKVSSDAARLLESILAVLGLHWRIWSDPTDLIAFCLVPVAWRMSEDLSQRNHSFGTSLPQHALVVAVASLACLATSVPFSNLVTSAYLVNMTSTDREVRLLRVRVDLDCDRAEADPSALDPTLFQPERCEDLEVSEAMAVDRAWARETEGPLETFGDEDPPCDAVIVQTDGVRDTLLFWKRTESVTVHEHPGLEDDPDEHAVYLEQAATRLYLVGSELIAAHPLQTPLPKVDCASLPSLEEEPPPRDAGGDGS